MYIQVPHVQPQSTHSRYVSDVQHPSIVIDDVHLKHWPWAKYID